MIRFTLDHQEREYPDDTPGKIAEFALRGMDFTIEERDFIRYLCREYIREQERFIGDRREDLI